MIEREQRETSTDIFDYIRPAVIRSDWPSSIREVGRDIKETVYNGKTAIIGIFGPPVSGKTTTLRRILSEIPSDLITRPIEWGEVTKSKSLDNAEKTKSSTKLQGWRLSVLLESLGWDKRIASFESPLTTSFPIDGKVMFLTSDRGLSTLMKLSTRDSLLFSDFPFDLFVIGLFAEPEFEYAMRITREIIAHRLKQKPDELKRVLRKRGIQTTKMSNRAVRAMSIRVILEDKGQDTSEVSNKELLRYAREAADMSAIIGIDRETDEVMFQLADKGIINVDKEKYLNDRDYRLSVLSQKYMPRLFDTLGKPSLGRNVFFVGTVARAERLKFHSLKAV